MKATIIVAPGGWRTHGGVVPEGTEVAEIDLRKMDIKAIDSEKTMAVYDPSVRNLADGLRSKKFIIKPAEVAEVRQVRTDPNESLVTPVSDE